MTITQTSKWISLLTATLVLTACGNGDDNGDVVDDNGDETAGGTLEGAINVITREEGSGTRDAFEDLFGIEEGELDFAITQQGTNALMTNVADDDRAIAYTSVGSLNDTVKALSVGGVDATPENISAGDYEVFRNFNIVYGDDLSDIAQDFWDFILSAEGQAIVEDEGYVAADADAPEYSNDEELSGSINVGGSTSVEPVMAVLVEAYSEHQSGVSIDLQGGGSGAGITGAQDGTLDIGMASRDIEDAELADLGGDATIAIDGIAIIVNPSSPLEDISQDDVSAIFTQQITEWSEVQ